MYVSVKVDDRIIGLPDFILYDVLNPEFNKQFRTIEGFNYNALKEHIKVRAHYGLCAKPLEKGYLDFDLMENEELDKPVAVGNFLKYYLPKLASSLKDNTFDKTGKLLNSEITVDAKPGKGNNIDTYVTLAIPIWARDSNCPIYTQLKNDVLETAKNIVKQTGKPIEVTCSLKTE